MSLKAELKIHLLANEVLVAESADAELWRRVLAAIQGGEPLSPGSSESNRITEQERTPASGSSKSGDPKTNNGIDAFAQQVGATVAEVTGSCSPEESAPYLHLDPRNWESFKRSTPARGAGAIGPIQIAATLLCLWFKHAGIEARPTQAEALKVLETIGAKDPNASRSIKNCEWLQNRGDGVQINPAKHSRAVAVAKAYITESSIDSE